MSSKRQCAGTRVDEIRAIVAKYNVALAEDVQASRVRADAKKAQAAAMNARLLDVALELLDAALTPEMIETWLYLSVRGTDLKTCVLVNYDATRSSQVTVCGVEPFPMAAKYPLIELFSAASRDEVVRGRILTIIRSRFADDLHYLLRMTWSGSSFAAEYDLYLNVSK